MADLFMQLGEFRPVQALLVMMSGMISKITCQKIKEWVSVVVRCMELIIGIQTAMMVKGHPGSK